MDEEAKYPIKASSGDPEGRNSKFELKNNNFEDAREGSSVPKKKCC